MTDIIIILILVAVLVFSFSGAKKRLKGGCCGGGNTPKKVKPKNTNTAEYTYKMTVYIDGMTCDHCKTRVENAFNSLKDCYAKVNLRNKCAEVWVNEQMSEEEIAELIKKSGYTFVGFSRD